MRIGVDTGVLISAAIKVTSVPANAVYRATHLGPLLKSDSTEAELMEVIDRPHLARLIAPVARAHMVELMAWAELVQIIERVSA
jgi:predicted nucleic acid-binding protein